MEKNKVGDLPGVDGVDHINFYSRGATEIGRLGSHFAFTPFTHPEDGDFDSMEGYWYWRKRLDKDDPKAEELRKLYGFAAKELGRTIPSVDHYVGFQREILVANWYKFSQNAYLRRLMVESTLPFNHYYVVGHGKVMVRPNGFDWLIEGWEKIRAKLKLQDLESRV